MHLLQPEWVDSIDSTNKFWKDQIKAGVPVESGRLLAAREQFAGRGRFDRKWLAKKNQNLTFSFVCVTEAAFPKIATIPMAAGLGVCHYLRKKGINAVGKWPNDVLVDNSKICGILSEKCSYSGIDYVIVGIGLNVNLTIEDAHEIAKPTTSIVIKTGESSDVADELELLLPYINKYIDIWEISGFNGIKDEWVKVAWKYGEEVVVEDGGVEVAGKMVGFGESGQLVLELSDTSLKEFWSGDVSIRRNK